MGSLKSAQLTGATGASLPCAAPVSCAQLSPLGAHVSFLYQVLIRIAAPLVFLATCLRGVRDRSYRDRLLERFGYTKLRFNQPPIWLHAVSVGEVQAATPLIRRLLLNREL